MARNFDEIPTLIRMPAGIPRHDRVVTSAAERFSEVSARLRICAEAFSITFIKGIFVVRPRKRNSRDVALRIFTTITAAAAARPRPPPAPAPAPPPNALLGKMPARPPNGRADGHALARHTYIFTRFTHIYHVRSTLGSTFTQTRHGMAWHGTRGWRCRGPIRPCQQQHWFELRGGGGDSWRRIRFSGRPMKDGLCRPTRGCPENDLGTLQHKNR